MTVKGTGRPIGYQGGTDKQLDLILTCFPERWDQPKRDALNLFDGVIEDINSKTRPPIRSVSQIFCRN